MYRASGDARDRPLTAMAALDSGWFPLLALALVAAALALRACFHARLRWLRRAHIGALPFCTLAEIMQTARSLSVAGERGQRE